jgi:hypothetical protein
MFLIVIRFRFQRLFTVINTTCINMHACLILGSNFRLLSITLWLILLLCQRSGVKLLLLFFFAWESVHASGVQLWVIGSLESQGAKVLHRGLVWFMGERGFWSAVCSEKRVALRRGVLVLGWFLGGLQSDIHRLFFVFTLDIKRIFSLWIYSKNVICGFIILLSKTE